MLPLIVTFLISNMKEEILVIKKKTKFSCATFILCYSSSYQRNSLSLWQQYLSIVGVAYQNY